MIRDGRDVALSTNRRLVELRGSRPVPAERMAKRWRHRILSARRVASIAGRYFEIRYEDLVLDTEPALRRVCEFVELDFDPGMLDYHERAVERLQEMNRERQRGARRLLTGEERMKAHEMTTKPPQAERIGGVGGEEARCLRALFGGDRRCPPRRARRQVGAPRRGRASAILNR